MKKPTEWAPTVFDSSLDSLTNLAEFTKGLTKTCQDALLDLAGCASDNDALNGGTITSLSTSNGCCLTDCSTNIKKASERSLRAAQGQMCLHECCLRVRRCDTGRGCVCVCWGDESTPRQPSRPPRPPSSAPTRPFARPAPAPPAARRSLPRAASTTSSR